MNEKFPDRDSKLPADPADLKDLHLAALKPDAKPYDRLVGAGLILRVMPSGNVSFRFNYRLDGKQKVVTIGLYPKKTLKVLRAEYDLLAERVSREEDVSLVTKKKKAARRTKTQEVRAERQRERNVLRGEAFAELFIKYLENPNTVNKRGRPYSAKTIQEYKIHLLKHYVPRFGKLPVEEIRRKDISSWLEDVASRTPTQANRIMATVGVMYRWATDKEMVEVNPVAGMKKPAANVQKDRALDYDPEMEEIVDRGEIVAFWNGIEDVNPIHRTALRLILMTLLRPSEVLGTRWEHILADKWIIPVSATKSNKSAHKVPLTSDVKKMLKELRAITGNTPFLFPESRYSDGELILLKSGKTGKYAPVKHNTIGRLLKGRFEIESFSPHDLRRTASTHLIALGYMKAEIGMLLHHSTADVTSLYARGDDMPRKLKMLNAWHRKLKQVISKNKKSNVVSMR